VKNNKSLWNQEIDPGYYDEALTSGINLGRGIRAAWHDRTFNHVLNNINYSSKNLDYACGSGSFLGLYFKNNSIGFDISEKQIQHAKSKYTNKDINFTTDINVVKKSAPYESITLLGLLEFLDHEDSVNLLNELYDLLEDNGVLIITTPNYKFTMKLLFKLLNKFGRVNYQDITINMHTYKSLNKLFELTKFEQYKIQRILTAGIFASAASLKLAIFLDEIFQKLFKFNLGFLLLANLQKK